MSAHATQPNFNLPPIPSPGELLDHIRVRAAELFGRYAVAEDSAAASQSLQESPVILLSTGDEEASESDDNENENGDTGDSEDDATNDSSDDTEKPPQLPRRKPGKSGFRPQDRINGFHKGPEPGPGETKPIKSD